MGWDAEDAEDAYWAARADEVEPEIPEDWDGTPPESDFEDPPEDAPDWNVRTDTALTGTTARHQPFRADEISVNQIAPPPERREGCRMWHDESQTIGQEKTRTMRKNAILAQIERAEATLRDLRAELSKIDRPAEPTDLTDSLGRLVITFNFRFNGMDRIYTFAAVRTNGRWYLTGHARVRPDGMTWDELMGWVDSTGEIVGGIDVATRWKTIPR